MKKIFNFEFIPSGQDLALLFMRIGYGGLMFWLHGCSKLMRYNELTEKFADPLGVGHQTSLILTLFGEIVCALLVVLGFWTRFAALGVAITLGVAFVMAHGAKLAGPGNGELALVYAGVFAALFIAGPGRFSLDAKLGAKI